MRTAIIPAQIITVEDKIAGNLSFQQITILIIPLIFAMVVYIVFPPIMKFSMYKSIILLLVTIVSLFLTLRIKGIIVFQWILILLCYNLRPGYYIFNKNDITGRALDMPIISKTKSTPTKKQQTEEIQIKDTPLISDQIKLERVLSNPRLSIKFETTKKGGLTIAVTQKKT
jgi:hypothetical protein